MKIKALKQVQSPLVLMNVGDVKDVELDAYTLQNWVENGLIEVVNYNDDK